MKYTSTREDKELLNFKRSQSTLIEDIETKISNLKSQAKSKSGDLDKLSSLLALTLNGSDLKKSYEVQYELKKMKTIIIKLLKIFLKKKYLNILIVILIFSL